MNLYYQDNQVTIYNGEALEVLQTLQDESVNMCVTSPPYWGLRQYLPDMVQLKKSLSGEEKERIIKDLTLLGINGIIR